MLRFVVNDVRLNTAWLFFIFVLLNFRIAGSMALYVNHYDGLNGGISFAMLMPLIVLLREEYYRGDNVLHSLPLRKDRLIYAKYISIILLGIAPAVYGWSYQQLIEYLGPHGSLRYHAQQLEAGYSVEHSLIARAIGCSLLLAMGMPLIVKFGSFWRVLIAFIALQFVWGKMIDHLLDLSLRTSWFLGMSRWVFFVSIFIIAILSISARFSIWLSSQRDL